MASAVVVVVPLDTRIALLAADLHREHKLATADAIVYATPNFDQGLNVSPHPV